MAYSATTTLLYGVEINPEQAQCLHAVLVKAANPNGELEDSMDGTLFCLDLDNIKFAGDQTDSRCHLCGGFEDQYPVDTYFVGVEVSEKKSSFVKLIEQGPTEKMLKDWSQLHPYLEKAGISSENVGFHHLNQIL